MVEKAMLNGANIIDKLTKMEKDLYNRELLFMKYVNNYIYLSKDVPEEKLTALSEKYNKDGIVLKVIENFDEHHNSKINEKTFQITNELQEITAKLSKLNDEEKTIFIKEDPAISSFISRNNEWQKDLEAATEALMCTIQELV